MAGLLARAGVVLAVALLALIAFTAEPFDPIGLGPGQDARAYWSAPLDDPYAGSIVGAESAYLYSPAFLQALAPLRILPWTPFLVAWTGLLLLALRALSGPLLFAPLVVLTFPELWGGNITILLAGAVVLGFRAAGAWALPLLTKVTPGVGLLWFLVRREWGALFLAAIATLAVTGLSALLAPDAWRSWVDLLRASAGASTVSGSIPIPFLLRLPVALLVIAWAARRDARWLLPVGVLLAMPVIWPGSLALLAGSVALRRREIERALLSRLPGRSAPSSAPIETTA